MEEKEKRKKPWHEQWWFITLMVIVGLIIISTGIFSVMNRKKNATFIPEIFYPFNYPFNPFSNEETKQTEDLPFIDVNTLLQAFKDNEAKAREEYIGKEYIISGFVESKEKMTLTDIMGKFVKEVISVSLTDRSKSFDFFVNCHFYNNKPGLLDNLNEGYGVNVKGTIADYSTNILVENCELNFAFTAVPDYAP